MRFAGAARWRGNWRGASLKGPSRSGRRMQAVSGDSVGEAMVHCEAGSSEVGVGHGFLLSDQMGGIWEAPAALKSRRSLPTELNWSLWPGLSLNSLVGKATKRFLQAGGRWFEPSCAHVKVFTFSWGPCSRLSLGLSLASGSDIPACLCAMSTAMAGRTSAGGHHGMTDWTSLSYAVVDLEGKRPAATGPRRTGRRADRWWEDRRAAELAGAA